MLIHKNDRILFQGDSITDCGRDRDVPSSLGSGYVDMVSQQLGTRYPGLSLECINRGISGNRVVDLLSRWKEDCLDLKPNVLSLMIGINDVWRRYDQNTPTTVEDYASGYANLLDQVRETLPGTRLILMEPFLLPVPEDRLNWREDLDPKIQAVRHLARDFGAVYVPLDGLFAAAATRQPPAFWAHDGVHPSSDGHALIANAWLQAAAMA